jgi:large subunit ribosomal protein L18|tara:strand:- start:457 stop:825 length:369 start_codon:yes stop_codon:yes gene_type:complete
LAGRKTIKQRASLRHVRLRKKIKGTAARPRLAVYRSLNHVYAQLIDDDLGVTIASASSVEGDVKKDVSSQNKTEISRLVGTLVAKRAINHGISKIVFDRGGNKYHGRVKALADAARQGGLVI